MVTGVQNTLSASPDPSVRALVDSQKMFNALEKATRSVGFNDVSRFFNDPSKPEQQLVAEVESLRAQLEQVTAQLQNPLAEAETVRQRGTTIREQLKDITEREKALLKVSEDDKDRARDDEQFIAEQTLKWTELELEHNQDLPLGVAQ